jgi:hypothetical protein
VTYWSGAARRARSAGTKTPHVRLLPAYDEYTVGYADRSPLLERGSRLSARGMGLLSPVVLVDGKIVGTWKRTIRGGSVRVEARLARKLARDEGVAMEAAVADYGRFLGLEAHRGPIR